MLHNQSRETKIEVIVSLETKLFIDGETIDSDCHQSCIATSLVNTASFSGDEPSVWDLKIRRLSQL